MGCSVFVMSYHGPEFTRYLTVRFEQLDELMALLGIVSGEDEKLTQPLLSKVKELSSEIVDLKQRLEYLEAEFRSQTGFSHDK
jgi:hypothetical protein